MAYIHKKNKRWHVDIRKKGFPNIYKGFLELKDARKFARDIESQMERNVFEDYSGASGTTLKEIFELYIKKRKFHMFPIIILLIALIGVTTLSQSGLVAFIYPI